MNRLTGDTVGVQKQEQEVPSFDESNNQEQPDAGGSEKEAEEAAITLS